VEKLTFQQMHIFLETAKTLNVSKTAEKLYISQPSVSKTLQRFEDGVGLKLFYRTNVGIKLTHEGEYLLETLDPLFHGMEHAIHSIQNPSVKESNRKLRMAIPITYEWEDEYDFLDQKIAEYESIHTDVSIVEHLYDNMELRRALEYGNEDLVISPEFVISDIKGITMKMVKVRMLYIVMSSNHPLAQSEQLDFNKLNDEVFYFLSNSGNYEDRDEMFRHCRNNGFTPKKLEFSPTVQSLLHTIRRNHGMSIYGKFSSSEGDDRLRYFDLASSKNRPHIVISWRDGRLSREAKDFLELFNN
jgi:DNA-binding transcriptional LysR family regulator